MRPPFLAAAAALLAASPLAAQPARNHLWSSYDELEACTTVMAKVYGAVPASPGGVVEVDVRTLHRDSAPDEPVRHVWFSVYAEHAGDMGTFGMAEPELVLVLDDSATLRYPVRRFSRPFPSRRIPGGVAVAAYFPAPAADLPRIARAARVRGKAGTLDFALAPRHLVPLRQLAAYTAREPGAPVPRRSRHTTTDCDSFPPVRDSAPESGMAADGAAWVRRARG